MKSKKYFKKMTTYALHSAIGLIILSLAACDKDPFSPECVQKETAEITFDNRSAHSTYDVILDGARIGAISPGQTITRDVAAGQHSFIFRFSNGGGNACSEATPNLAICENSTFFCGTDQ